MKTRLNPIEIHPNALWQSLQLVIDSADFATHTSETLVQELTRIQDDTASNSWFEIRSSAMY